jgi:transposase
MLVGMKAYSLDLRQKILRAYDQRLGSQRALAALFGVSQSFVETLLRRRRTTGDIAPRPHAGGRRALCDEAALAVVRRLVHEHPAATLAELGTACAHFQDICLTDLPCRHIQCDEIWSFCYAKDKNLPEPLRGQFGYGSVWTWTAICADCKLVPC